MSPSIGSILRFRHQSSLRRRIKAREISSSNCQNGPSQIPPEWQHAYTLETHESNDTETNSRRFLGYIYDVVSPSLQALRTNNLMNRLIYITIAPNVPVVTLTLPIADQDEDIENDIDRKPPKRRHSQQRDQWSLIAQEIIAPQFTSAMIQKPALQQIHGTSYYQLPHARLALLSLPLIVVLTNNTREKALDGTRSLGSQDDMDFKTKMVSVSKALGLLSNVPAAFLDLIVFGVEAIASTVLPPISP